MKIIYSHKAARDLRRLVEFIAPHHSLAAIQVRDDLISAIKNLSSFPELGRKVKYNKETKALRELVSGDHVVRYAILGKEIHIIRMWHGKEHR